MFDEKTFELHLAKSEKTFTIPEDKTIVEVLHENGVEHPVSCEQGICATCIVTVLEGEPDHRDSILTDEEHNIEHQFTPCCSRSFSDRLVLDI